VKPTPLLSSVLHPKTLKDFTLDQLKELVDEIRTRIVQVLSVNGGHLASNLGNVELTVALHTIFSSPRDRLIFDVSHQTYTHKLLTGRNHQGFDKIRKTDGLSGFAHPEESEHDHFYAGHAATALSLALGVAHARDLSDSDEHVIPIIGDATLTCGLTFEALNNLPKDLKRFIVILNDNTMSISENVGGVTHLLENLADQPKVERLEIKQPPSFFGDLNLSYCGPIDGHDLPLLIKILEEAKELNHPILLHVLTKKGFSIPEAEQDPITYHGAKPFDLETCKFIPNPTPKPTFPKLFGKKMVEMATKDPSIVTVTPAMIRGSCLDELRSRFPDRVFDVGIAEGHAVTFCGGLANYHNMKVVCSIYSTFFQRALDNLFQDVCLQKVPVVFAVDRAGLAYGDGATHHGIYETSFLKAMPNMVICQPRNGQLLVELLESAFSWNRPTAIRYPNLPTTAPNAQTTPRALGKGEILHKGSEVLLIALGHLYKVAEETRALLLEKDIDATVVDPIFIKPLDTHLLDELLKTHPYVVTLEEHSLRGGLGEEVNHFVVTHASKEIEVLNVGIPDHFIEHGSHAELLEDLDLSPQRLTKKILRHFGLKTIEI
jgi:1-deoxy-D-xylulose-5-phosphate synthase